MTRRLVIQAAVLAAAAVAVPAAFAAAGPRLAEVGNVRFPDRARFGLGGFDPDRLLTQLILLPEASPAFCHQRPVRVSSR